MFNPSGAKPTSNVAIKEGSTYSFPDAYSGDYEFFDNRPIARTPPSGRSENAALPASTAQPHSQKSKA
jgi:hypothetical protein